MSDNPTSATFRRLKALMALRDHPGTPEEAASAAAKVQELLAKYNLEVAQVEQFGSTDDYTETPVDLGVPFGVPTAWRRQLLAEIAGCNFCQTVGIKYAASAMHQPATKQPPQISMLVGQPHNIEVVKYLFTYLTGAISSLGEASWLGNRYRVRMPKMQYMDSFYKGAVLTVARRLRSQQSVTSSADRNMQALMVVKDQALATAVKKFHPKLVAGPITNATSADAFNAGVQAGNRIQINKGLSGATPKPKQLN